jgi:hypothetical protein
MVNCTEHTIKVCDKEQVCEAVDCFNKGTERIEVSAGSYGSITLYLCSGCSPQFKEKQQ